MSVEQIEYWKYVFLLRKKPLRESMCASFWGTEPAP